MERGDMTDKPQFEAGEFSVSTKILKKTGVDYDDLKG